MILNNYMNLVGFMSSHPITATGAEQQKADIGLLDTDGNSCTPIWNSNNVNYYSVNCSKNHCVRSELSSCIGSGTTEPSKSDYALENDITNSFTDVSTSVNTANEDGKVKTIISVSGRNQSGETLTISEFGVLKTIYTGYASNIWQYKKVLMIREILNNPLTVPNGQGFVVTFEWIEA